MTAATRSDLQRLRVVLLVPTRIAPAWVHRVVEQLTTNDAASLVLVVHDASPAPRPRFRLSGAAFRVYETLDRRFFTAPDDHALPADLTHLIAKVPSLCVRMTLSQRRATMASDDIETIRSHRPDLLLSLGFPALEGDVLDAARLGVWRFDHLDGDDRVPPFAWETFRDAPALEACLRALTPSGERVVARGFARNDRNSLHRSRNLVIWKSTGLVARALQTAAAGRNGADEALPSRPFPAPHRIPSAFDVARHIARVVTNVVGARLRKRHADYLWFVALRPSQGSFVDGPLDGFRPLPMPPGRFWADPLLVADGSRTWLFFEDADVTSGKGLLRCAEVLADGSLGDCRVVLESDSHLSYPFVFRHAGCWYMLPETSENRTLELWRATKFPWEWELEKILMRDVVAVDPTLVERDGRLWLFVGLSDGGAAHDELFLFSANSIHDEWRPHPMNPIVSDARRARPAGALFLDSSQLYRPGQDCSGDYGSAIWIHRVDVLDEQNYRETPVRRIDADWHPGARCTHTLSRAGGFDALDARMWVRRSNGARPASPPRAD